MKKSKLLIMAAAVIVICCSAYAGVKVMADDSTATTAKDELILSVEDLTASNLVCINPYDTNDYGLYTNADKSLYTIVTDGGKKINTIKNSDSSITNISFATGCFSNNVVFATHKDGSSSILNLDGSYYSKIDGYYTGVTMEADTHVNNMGDIVSNAGGYFINNGQNFTFFKKDGSELFKIQGTGTIIWNTVNGYNVFQGTVGGVTYNGVYDNNLKKVYDSIGLSDDGKYYGSDGTNTIFFNKDGSELFRIPYSGRSEIIISWRIFNGYNALNIKNARTSAILYMGLYDNNLKLVMPTPEASDSIALRSEVLIFSSASYTSNAKFYYFNSNLIACPAPAPISIISLYTLPESFYADRYVVIDGIKFIVGRKTVTEGVKTLVYNKLFDISGKPVFDGFNTIYANGLCTIKDETSGKFKLVQLSAKTLNNASKSGITLGSNNVVTGDISVAVNANGADTTVTEPLKIHIEAANNVIPEGAFLCAGTLKADDGERFVLAQTAVASTASKFTVFDIDLLSASNMKVQPDGNVKITLGIPSTYSTSALKVYRIELDGTKTDMNATIVGGNIIFETNHFSIYVLSDETVVKVSDVVNTSVPTPDATPPQISPTTYDGSPITYYVIIAVLAIGCLSTILLFNKKKYNKE